MNAYFYDSLIVKAADALTLGKQFLASGVSPEVFKRDVRVMLERIAGHPVQVGRVRKGSVWYIYLK